ncbi:hypothetical protein X777_15852 [Ooceraea biroi]|uniref:Uncharacterized protein n=1 Tax=Ooceraea biroi TaxID=2015173 RepID=A0A026WVS8_OOCBI|nr:hypothetical protein X777_15852 [Ooceraea biroi]
MKLGTVLLSDSVSIEITRQRSYSCFVRKNGSIVRRNSPSKSWHEKRSTDDLRRDIDDKILFTFTIKYQIITKICSINQKSRLEISVYLAAILMAFRSSGCMCTICASTLAYSSASSAKKPVTLPACVSMMSALEAQNIFHLILSRPSLISRDVFRGANSAHVLGPTRSMSHHDQPRGHALHDADAKMLVPHGVQADHTPLHLRHELGIRDVQLELDVFVQSQVFRQVLHIFHAHLILRVSTRTDADQFDLNNVETISECISMPESRRTIRPYSFLDLLFEDRSQLEHRPQHKRMILFRPELRDRDYAYVAAFLLVAEKRQRRQMFHATRGIH